MEQQVNKILTLFEVEAKDFTKDVERADKSVENLKKRFKEANKEILDLKKDVKDLGKEIDNLEDHKALELDIDTSKAKRSLESAEKALNQMEEAILDIDKAADRALDSLKDPKLNLSVFSRLEDMLKRISKMDLIDLDSIKAASREVDALVKDLESIDTDIQVKISQDLKDVMVEIDTTPLKNLKVQLDDNLRHWIDNNNGGMGQASDDTHKVLQDILVAIKTRSQEDEVGKPGQDIELDTTKLEMSTEAMNKTFNRTNESIKQLVKGMGAGIERTGDYIQEMVRMREKLQNIGYDEGTIRFEGLELPEDGYYDDMFEEAEEALKRIQKQLKTLLSDFDNVEITNFEELERVINRIQGAQEELGEETLKWVGATSKAEEGFKQTNKALEETEKKIREITSKMDQIDFEARNGQLSEQDAIKQLRALRDQEEALKEQRRLLVLQANEQEAYLSLNQKITKEFKEQNLALERNRLTYMKQVDDMKEAERAQKELTRATQEQGYVMRNLKDMMNSFKEAFSPIMNLQGLDKVSGGIGQMATSSAAATKGIGSLSKALSGMGAAGVAAVGAVGAALGAGVAAIGSYVAGFKVLKRTLEETLPAYHDLEKAISRIQAVMGDAADSYEDTKKVLGEGFASQGHIKDVEAYADALGRVKQQLEDLEGFDYSDAGLATNDVLTFSSLSGYDPNEIIRAARNMSINFGIEVSKALDMITSAYQRTGDPMNDLLDTMQEYPSQFRKMGISAETFYDLIVRGSEAGVHNTDKIADTFKELYLRIAQGADIAEDKLREIGYTAEDIERVGNASDNVIRSFNKLGLNVNSIKRGFEEGGEAASSALYTIIDAIAAVEDKAAQQQIIADLFGAPGEDVGSYFFEILAQGEIAVNEFAGAVQNASSVMENTLSYQMSEIQNKMTFLKAEVGETFGNVFTLVLQDLNANFDAISQAVTGSLIPALEMLGFAIVDPFVDGQTSASGFVVTVIEGAAGMIEGLAYVINGFNKCFAAIRIVTNAIEILWNVLQMVWDGLNLVALAVINTFGMLFAKIVDGAATLVTNFKTVCENMGIAARNGATAIYNAFGKGFSLVQQQAAKMVNGVIGMINKIPGVNIQYRASWGEGFEEKGYESYKELTPVTTMQDKVSGYVDPMTQKYQASLSKNFDDLMKDINDLGNAWDDVFTTTSFNKRFEEVKNKLNTIKQEQKQLQQNNNKPVNKPTVKPPVSNNFNGTTTDSKETAKDIEKYEKAQKEAAKAEKEAAKASDKKKANQEKQNALKKEEEKLQKELNELIKQEQELQKEIFEETKRQIELEKEYADDRRSWEEAIMDQQVKLRQNKEEALLLEIAMIDEIRSKYALTAEEQISYIQKQFDLALNLRDQYLNRYKDAIQKEIDAVKDSADEELKIEKRKNDKLIKDKERQIKAIEALMRENDYQNDQEDLDYEIKQVEKELSKYINATSLEGIQKREELEERLRELRLEKERAQKRKELEDQKQQLEDEIDQIEEANEEAEQKAEEKAEAMEKIYDDMFKELEEVLSSGMFDIGKIQELAQTETNATIKKLLDDMVLDYQRALKLIEQYTLNMKDIIEWDKNDASNDIIEGNLTGDKDQVQEGEDILDKNDNWSPSGENASSSAYKQAQAKYNKLKKEHSNLSAKKNKTEQDKKRLKQIEKEVAELKKIWGFSGFQDNSDFKPKSRSTFSVEAPQIPNVVDRIMPIQNAMNPRVVAMDSMQQTRMSHSESIVNNDTRIDRVLHIENFNNNSNADVKKIGQQLNASLSAADRSRGIRRMK